MSIVVNLLVALTFIQVWVHALPTMIGEELMPFKPFNCSTCLSWWLGVVLFILTQEIYFLTLYLCNEVYEHYT